MLKRFCIIIYGIFLTLNLHSQPLPNASNVTLGTNQFPISSNTFVRATSSIKLTPGFKFTPGSTSPYLYNLSISTNPPYINSNYNDPALAPFPPFNTNAVVGITEGSYAVSPNGTFVYNIPIVGAPGTSGIEPSLSINYNSEGVNGWFGVGWNLAGLSAITRTTKKSYHDGEKEAVNLSFNDVFSLDGNRLFINTGTYGTNGAVYKTEFENYALITSFGASGNGPQWFEVKDNKGKIYEYGRFGNSTLKGSGNNTALSWYINKVTDEFGNYMNYIYDNSNGEILIKKIEYTGNFPTISPYNKIEFEYIERSDANTIYFGGEAFQNKHLIKSITCLDINNKLVRRYVFNYQYNIYSLLNQINEVDANENDLNPTNIYWGEPETVNVPFSGNVSAMVNAGSALSGVKAADFDGDGFSDLVGLKLGFNNTYFYPSINNISSLPNVSAGPLVFFPLSNVSSNAANYAIPYNGQTNLGMYTIDDDDDNKEEVYAILAVAPLPANKMYEVVKLKTNSSGVLKASGHYSGTQLSNLDLSVYSNPNIIGNFAGNPYPFYFDVNDYTGDSKKDELICDQERVILKPHSSTGYPNATYPSDKYAAVKTGDFDGDGKLEIFLMVRLTGAIYDIKVLSYDTPGSTNLTVKANFQKSFIGGPVSSGSSYEFKCIDVGDVNGDGKSDVVFHDDRTFFQHIYAYFSNGITFEQEEDLGLDQGTTPANERAMFLRDVNHDGKADIIATEDLNSTTKRYSVLFSNGKTLTSPFYFTQNGTQIFSDYGDFNGDGNVDFYGYAGGSTEAVTFKPFVKQREQFVTKIQNIKRAIEINYSFLGSWFGLNSQILHYETVPSSSILAPLSKYRPSTCVVTSVKFNNNIFRYAYLNGVLNREGKGFLGFEKIRTVEDNDLIGSVTSHTYNPTFGVLENTEIKTGKFVYTTIDALFIQVFDIIPSMVTSKTTNFSKFYQTTPKCYFLERNVVNEVDYLKSTKSEHHVLYDPNSGGNIASSNRV